MTGMVAFDHAGWSDLGRLAGWRQGMFEGLPLHLDDARMRERQSYPALIAAPVNIPPTKHAAKQFQKIRKKRQMGRRLGPSPCRD
jgi:hypothetical protein